MHFRVFFFENGHNETASANLSCGSCLQLSVSTMPSLLLVGVIIVRVRSSQAIHLPSDCRSNRRRIDSWEAREKKQGRWAEISFASYNYTN